MSEVPAVSGRALKEVDGIGYREAGIHRECRSPTCDRKDTGRGIPWEIHIFFWLFFSLI